MSASTETPLEQMASNLENPTRPLSMVVDKLREELAALQRDAEGKDLRFQVEEIEVELHVGITAKAGGEIGFDCWLYKAKGTADIERASTQTVKLKLKPSVRVEPGTAAREGLFINDMDLQSR